MGLLSGLFSCQQEYLEVVDKNYEESKRNSHAYRISCGCLCVHICGCADLYFPFWKWNPAIGKIGLGHFISGMDWKPLNNIFGIFPMIIGSIYVTAGAIIVGVPIGILCAVYMAKFCPKGLYKIFKPAINLMAGIPSIVYGFFGLVVLVPIVQNMHGGSGKGVLTASVLLGHYDPSYHH